MAYLEDQRGPGQHAQLIGGEVTLLGPDVHGDALELMQAHGRKPMSMSHGDFDYDYLVALAIRPDGRRRFDHLSFALHVDSTMAGRRAVGRPTSEAELHPERQRICEMFARLRREHGVRSYLAHNMTVTPANLDQVADVVRSCRGMGFRMFSFQPAALVGSRTTDDGGVDDDALWREVERGAGVRLPSGALQVGDPRCNRTTWGVDVAGRYIPFLDDCNAVDLRARDALLRTFPGFDFGTLRPHRLARLIRVLIRHPDFIRAAAAWAVRFAQRAGPTAMRHVPRPLTFVMHSFMDARVVAPAWQLLQRGERSTDPELQEAQERLGACSYLMAHPDSDQLVPACAQHAVFGPNENRRLRRLLPLRPDPTPG